MKYLFSFLPVVLLVLFSQTANAQLSASSEPRAQATASGEVIIMPFIPPVSETVAVTAPAPKAKRHNAMRVTRTRKTNVVLRRNGYFQMAPNQNWGANYRLGHFGMAQLN